MFDQLKGLGAMAGLMKDLPRIKARMEEVKAELERVEVVAETGGGAVRARANGAMKLVALEIDPAMLAALVDADVPDDRQLACDLVVGAVNAALDRSRERAAEHLARAADEFGLPVPPGGIAGLLG